MDNRASKFQEKSDKKDLRDIPQLNKNNFIVKKKIAKGNFGKIWLAMWKNETLAKKVGVLASDPIVIKQVKLKHESEITQCENEKDIMQALNAKQDELDVNDPRKNRIIKFQTYGLIENKLKDEAQNGMTKLLSSILYESKPNSISYCLGMEYMPNGSLFNLINIQPKYNVSGTIKINIVKEVAYGLLFMHENNYLHCDIKSHNILLTADWHAKIADFGLSHKADDDFSREGCWYWMAPEVICNNKNTLKADVFSFATVCWEIAAWSHPFKSFNNLNYIITEVPKGLRETIPDNCHPKFAQLIDWGWMQDPSERPTMKQVIEKIEKDNIEDVNVASENNNSNCSVM